MNQFQKLTIEERVLWGRGEIILNAAGHPRQTDEQLVDLTAMLSGFWEFYLRGTTTRTSALGRTTIHRFGYLSEDEVKCAAQVMREMSQRSSAP